MISLLLDCKNAPSDRRGVTLIEIMISFIILCVAAIGAAGIISHGHRETTHDFRRGEALQILVDRMNFLSSLPFKTLNDAIGGTSKKIDSNFKNVSFGKVTVGQNSYEVTAVLKKQPITFNNLMELEFPNKNYVYDKPNTWRFRYKNTRTESFASLTGDYAYAVIKITVDVTPVDGKVVTKEKTYSAITYVCNTE
ncbi:MAG: prepilin-type N-terminal cleavage/methylation domain-containing protein [Candidatus Riflebacteria bacterium]|jgi:Tfp pilus assembly protein PilE|nr:prepilin-type N-terminal cleavage/methylation domain-containing protein [Candidatus Riflebacteria bacterium]